MWWNKELKRRRLEVQRLRGKVSLDHQAESHRSEAPQSKGLSPIDLAALGFAAFSLVGSRRALKLALAAASLYRSVKAVNSAASIMDRGAHEPPSGGGARSASNGHGRATSRI